MYRVLLVDDEHWALLALRSLIDWESCGFTIIGEEENGERALLTLEQEQPELVISDIRMPGMDGPRSSAASCARKRRKRKCCS